MKKFAKLCATILVLFVVLAASALAAEVLYSGTCGSNLTWTLDDEGTLRIEGNGRMEYYSSYSSIPWYNYRSLIKSAVIGKGVTNIGNYAFSGCSSLTSMAIPEGVTSIGGNAFYYCSSLTSVTIPEGVTSIGNFAFFGCSSLTSMNIPEGVTNIGNFAFSGCSNLTLVTIPEGVTSLGDGVFEGCSLTSMTIPDSVKRIGNFAFYNCGSLVSVTIPSSVTSIGNSVFYNCGSLVSVTIPSSVTSIGNSVFYDCSSLMSVTIPESVTSIGDSAFGGCSSLTSVTIPESVTSVGNYAFSGCSSLTSVTIPESVTSIGNYAFGGCSDLTGITVNEKNTKYSNDECGVLFDKDKTALIRYPIGNTATKYEIPSSVTSIGRAAFENCSSLASVTIPEGVTSIGYEAFYGCSSLTSVAIPTSVVNIGSFAFDGCTNLKSVYITDLAAWCEIKFNVKPDLISYFRNNHSANPLYNGADLYINGEKAANIEIPMGVTNIGDSAFYHCSSLTTVTIPKGVTNIGDSAFSNCSSLMSVTIPTSVTSIGSSCFSGSGLKDIYYTGVKSQFVRINIGTNNSTFNQATVHYQGVAVTGVSLNRTSLTLMQGESAQLIATVLPANASDKTVTWSVTNPTVASVAEGVVSALNAGTTEIKVTTADGGFTAVCTMTVTAPPTILNRDTVLILDDSYSMNGTPLTELKKAAIKFCKNVLEANGNNRIALVIYEAGTTVYDFTTDITSLTASINAMRGYGNYTNTNYALQKANALIAKSNADVKSVVLMTDGVPTCGDSDVKTAAAAVRSHATLFTLGFFHNISGSNKTRAQQLLQAIKSEEYYYEVKDGSKLDESFFEISEAITKIPVTGLSLDKEKIVLTEGESLMLNASLEPHDTTERKIYWSSSNTAVATVSENGTVTAVSEGSVTVTAVSANTEIKAECTVIVNSSEAWYYTYTVKDDGTAEITGYRTGLQGDIVIPSYVYEYRVTSIGGRAFYDCRALTSAIIPAGVTSIGDDAFLGCSNLKSVYITDLTAWCRIKFHNAYSNPLKNGADLYISGEKATNIEIPMGVTSIGDYAFCECSSLTTVIIPSTVTSIGNFAFDYCSRFTSVIIPEGVTSIGRYAFSYCSNLKSVYITDLVAWCKIKFENYASNPLNNGADLYINEEKATNIEILEDVTNIGNYVFSGCSSLTLVNIPLSVTYIGESAFSNCSSLTSVNIPASVTYIGNYVFSGCSSLSLVNIPLSVTYIGERAFSNCSSLASVNIPSSVTYIGKNAFSDCSSLISITVDEGNAKYLSDERGVLFNKDKTTLIQYPVANTATSYKIPSSVTSIAMSAFPGCISLTNITVDENNAKYSSDERGVLFSKDKTTLIQYPIGNTATSYGIPSSVTSIGSGAFRYCSSLTSVTIPESVTSIAYMVFDDCSSLKDVYYPGTKEAWKKITIGLFNDPLTRAAIHYNATVLTPSVTRTADGTVYKVSAANLPVSSVVVVALYKDGRFVGYESAVYNGETLEIAADTPHDSATILAWSDLETLIPLAPGTKIGS